MPVHAPDALARLLVEHPSWKGTPLLGQPGYSLPNLEGLIAFSVDVPDQKQALLARGIRITGAPPQGGDNIVYLDPDAPHSALEIFLSPEARGSQIILARGAVLGGRIEMNGGNVFVCGHTAGVMAHIRLEMRWSGNLFSFGAGTTCYGLNCSVEGPHNFICIGDDCMFSDQITIRATDHHSIFDLASGELMNPAGSVTVGPHVWVSPHVAIFKDVTIGRGSILATAAVVTTSVPEFSLAGGVPAKVLRRGIAWSRDAPSATAGRKWKMQSDLRMVPREG